MRGEEDETFLHIITRLRIEIFHKENLTHSSLKSIFKIVLRYVLRHYDKV